MQKVFQIFPVDDQLLVYTIELVFILITLLQPEPLDDTGLVEAGGCVSIKLQHFDLIIFIDQIKSAIDCRIVVTPGFLDIGDKVGRDSKSMIESVIDDMLHRTK